MKTLTSAAMAAKAIKQELKNVFPEIKFSVKSSNFSMGDSVHISWNDGPTEKEVNAFTSKYQYGSFNGMEDIYENTNRRSDIPQSKYVSCSRKLVEIEKLRSEYIELTGCETWNNTFYRFASNYSIPAGAANLRIVRSGITCGLQEDFYKIAYDLPNNPKQTKINGSFVIVDYSDRAVAVFGNTKPIKEELKNFGGRFNPRLNHEGQKKCGWIFPKSKKEELNTFLNNSIPSEVSIATGKEINLSDSLMKKAETTKAQAEKIDDSVKGNWTYRRQNMADSMKRRKDDLFKQSKILKSLALMWQNNTIPEELKCIKSKADVDLLLHGCYPSPPDPNFNGWYNEEYPKRKKKIDSMGIMNEIQFNTIKEQLNNIGLTELTAEEKAEKQKQELLKTIHAANIPGFFPTPDYLIDKMIDYSGITHVKRILEPSAGIGSIALKVADLCDELECCEINYTLYNYLELQGFKMIDHDVMDLNTSLPNKYDAIFMNPPFEKRQDLQHIMFLYEFLNDTGKIVSIISAGTFTNQFDNWLSDKVYEIYDVENGSFKNSFNSTGVSVKIIIIDK